jgi:hypothetical protein
MTTTVPMATVVRAVMVTAAFVLASCGGGADALGAWSAPESGATSGSVWMISEISDALPLVERQLGRGGPVVPFVDRDAGLLARATIVEVAPLYSVAPDPDFEGQPERSIENVPQRRVVDYGSDTALWSVSRVTIDIVDDYGHPALDLRRLVVDARGLVEDIKQYIGADVIVSAAKTPGFAATNGTYGMEWSLLHVIPIDSRGNIAWPDGLPVGRSTTIDALDPNKTFLKPFKSTSTSAFTLAPVGTGTEVTWSMTGTSSGLTAAFMKVFNMEKAIGKDFERGLASLKQVAESGE